MMRKPTRSLLALLLLATVPAALGAADRPAGVLLEVLAEYPGASPEEVERQVTIPLEVALSGLPRLGSVRSQSLFGLAYLRLEFEAGTDRDRARQGVIDRLGALQALPPGVTPQLSSGTLSDQLLRYTLRGPKDVYSSGDLRALQDWVLGRAFRRVPRIIDVVGSGGTLKRYEIRPDPDRMKRFGITLAQLVTAVEKANGVGGDFLKPGPGALEVRDIGLFGGGKDPLEKALRAKDPAEAAAALRAEERSRLREIRRVVLATVNEVPVRVEDVVEGGRLVPGAEEGRQGVVVGQQPRTSRVGIARQGGTDEDDVVQGVVLLRPGEDAGEALRAVRARIKELNDGPGQLLPGVRIEPFYERGRPAGEDVLWGRGVLSAGASLEETSRVARRARAVLLGHPEVELVASEAGNGEVGDGPAGLNRVRLHIRLRPVKDWPAPPGKEAPRSRAELLDALRTALRRQLPGIDWDLAADFRDEFQAVFRAGRGEGVLKVFGPDLEALDRLAERARKELAGDEAVTEAHVTQVFGRDTLEFRIDPAKCAKWGLKAADVNKVVQAALGGVRMTRMVEGDRTFDVTLLWPEPMRANEEAILNLPVDVGGPRVRLRDLLAPREEGRPARKGVAVIYREQGRRLIPVHFRLRDPAAADMDALRKKLAPLFAAPYRAEWERGS